MLTVCHRQSNSNIKVIVQIEEPNFPRRAYQSLLPRRFCALHQEGASPGTITDTPTHSSFGQQSHDFILQTTLIRNPVNSIKQSNFVTPLIYCSRVTTTVSRLFTDKAGAAPQDSSATSSGESSNTSSTSKRPSIFQRFHIHPGRRSKTTPNLTIRPTTSSSLPPVATSARRAVPGSSHSDAATIAEITQTMPQSLTIGTPPSVSVKRQRSQELPINVSQPPTSGQASANGSTVGSDGSARQPSVKVPAYLDKDRASECRTNQTARPCWAFPNSD